jgi:hypothetical protein
MSSPNGLAKVTSASRASWAALLNLTIVPGYRYSWAATYLIGSCGGVHGRGLREQSAEMTIGTVVAEWSELLCNSNSAHYGNCTI